MKTTPPYVYFMQDTATGLVKIGFSRDLRQRRWQLASDSKHPINLLAFARGDRTTEGDLHRLFEMDLVGGEWFRRSPALDALIQFIKEFPSIHADLPSRVREKIA